MYGLSPAYMQKSKPLKEQIEAAFEMPDLPDGEYFWKDAYMVRDEIKMRVMKIVEEHSCKET